MTIRAEVPVDSPKPELSVEEQEQALIDEGVIPGERSEVPEKFRGEDGEIDVQKLLKSYQELEKVRARPDADDGADAGEDDYPDDDPRKGVNKDGADDEQREAAQKAVDKAGLDLDEVSAEWWENGGLSQETYDALEASGIPPFAVDTYIDGLIARNSKSELAVYDAVGGQAEYEALTSWAAGALEDDEIEAYDEAVNSGNKATILMAVRGLQARYNSNQSNEPMEQLSSKGNSASRGSKYESWEEMTQDQMDPRYGNDPAYTQRVEQKAMRSNL